MNTWIRFILSIAIIIVIIIIFFIPKSKESLEESLKLEKMSKINENQDIVLSAPEGITKEMWDRIVYYHEIWIKNNTDIDFYGKVVDQEGDPIAGVRVNVEITCFNEQLLNQLREGVSKDDVESKIFSDFELVTDDEGLFKFVNGKGTLLKVLSLEKDGYTALNDGVISFSYNSEKPQPKKVDSPRNPALFRMWKNGPSQPLQEDRLGMKIIANGESNSFEMFQGSAGLNINVSVNTVLVEENSKKYDWSINLNVDEGFVCETDDQFLFSAPESGYESQYNFEMRKGDSNYHIRLEGKKLYFYEKRRNIYGSIVMTIYVYRDGTAYVEMAVVINETGSRSLQP